MTCKDLIGKKVIDILQWQLAKSEEITEGKVYIKLDSGELVALPRDFVAEIDAEITENEIESLFFEMGRVLFTGEPGIRRRNDLPYIEMENKAVVDVILLGEEPGNSFLELANGFIIGEKAGLVLFRSLEEFEAKQGKNYRRLQANTTDSDRDRAQVYTEISKGSHFEPSLITALTEMVNAVYAEAEGPLWAVKQDRTNEDEIARLILESRLVLAFLRNDIVGCVDVESGDDGAMFGMLVCDPNRRGLGIGSKLVVAAEEYAKDKGQQYMRLELLTPQSWKLEQKEFLFNWYTRLGYEKEYVADFAEKYPDDVHKLATPCDFTVYCKKLV